MAYNSASLDLEASSSQYAYVADNAALSITGDISIEAWIKYTTPTTESEIVNKVTYTNNFSYRFYLDNSPYNLKFQYSQGGTTSTITQRTCNTTMSAYEGKWIHVAVTVDVSAKDIKFYINGELQSSTANDQNAISIYDGTSDFRIGSSGASNYLNGLISNVRVWSDIRTQQEIQDNMYSILTGTDNNLVGSWFNDANDYNDDAGTNNLTAVNSPVFSTNVPWTGANSTDWSAPYQIQSDPTKVSGSSDHTNFPALISSDNLSSAVYAGLSDGELNGTGYLSDPALKAYYRFESGALTTDSSGESNTLTDIGTPSLGTGVFGGSAYFDGSEGYSISDDTDFETTNPFTISLWVKTSQATEAYLFQRWSRLDADVKAGWLLRLNGSGFPEFNSGDNTGSTENTDWKRVTGTTDCADGSWHHIVAGWSGSNLFVYVDGKKDATDVAWANAPGYNATGYFRIGCGNTSGSNQSFLTGDLDDVAFFDNKVLSSKDVQALYQGGSDLRITTDAEGTTEIPFEIVSLDTAGETCEIWAKVPALSYNSNTSLYIWYGNSSAVAYDANAPFGSQSVWTDYKLVQHNGLIDSSGNNTLTNSGSTTTTGQIGSGDNFVAGSSQYINTGYAPTLTDQNFTFQAWFSTSQSNAVILRSVAEKGANDPIGALYVGTIDGSGTAGELSWQLRDDANSNIILATTSTTYNDGSFHMVHGVRNTTANEMRIYADGSSVNSASDTRANGFNFSSYPFYLGAANTMGTANNFSTIVTDEVRVRLEVLTADWIATEYNNQNSPSTFWIPVSGRRIFMIS